MASTASSSTPSSSRTRPRSASNTTTGAAVRAACSPLPLALLMLLLVLVDRPADAKLITGLAPCPKGVPPARECLVSVLVDLRALRARARQRANGTLPVGPGGEDQQAPLSPLAPAEPSQDLPAAPPPPRLPPRLPPPPLATPPPQPLDIDLRIGQEQQQRRQQQLEQAVRFQEDELQQLREQVQELRLQLARALQLYQLTASLPPPAPPSGPGATPAGVKSSLAGRYYQNAPPVDLRAGFTGFGPAHEGAGRRFYRTLPALPAPAQQPTAAPAYGQRLSLAGLRELASGEAVIAT